ncbi:MAG: prepilin-type N-terminal cleavage/methylation domain-containing protein [Candidatus Eremiobacteraeota bacterium]|nr:prepilin-type N-terminal cleavage/methylation domain-containing protein [Candidatus Eremiobacteraeota bacterium]
MKLARKAHKPQSGFSIVEVMVVVVIMGIITTVVATMFAQGSSALKHGEAHNALQRAYRLISARVTPYISSAFDTNGIMGGATILAPGQTTRNTPPALPYDQAPRDPSGTTAIDNTLRFLTTEDFLDLAYPGVGTSASSATSLGTIGTFLYQIDLDAQNNIFLQKLVVDPVSGNISVPTASGDPIQKPLFFSRQNASVVAPIRYFHPTSDVLIMEVTLTGDDDPNERTRQVKPTQTFRTTFNLPAKIDT